MLHEVLLAREHSFQEWVALRDLEPVDSYRWGELNALAYLRRALDRGDVTAARMWAYVVRQCRAAEARAVLRVLKDVKPIDTQRVSEIPTSARGF